MRFDVAIRNGIVLTMDESMRVLWGGSVGIEDGKISYVGRDEVRGEEEIDARGCVVMPGLINCHTHAAMTLFRNAVEDQPLEKWLKETIWPREARMKPWHVRAGARLACLEMLSSGITCFNDHYFFMEEVAGVVDEAGMKAVLCEAMIELFDEERGREALRRGAEFAGRYRGWRGRIWTMLGPHAEYSCSLEFLSKVREEADRLGVGIHMHLAESRPHVEEFVRRNGVSPVKALDRIGFLKSDVILAHAIHLDDDDLRILAERDVAVSYNPVSNMKVCLGMARIDEMLRMGVRVGLGTDGPGTNNSLDLLQDLKTGALLQKLRYMDPTALPVEKAVWMATRGGALALGLRDTGSIKPGMRADVIVLDTRKPRYRPIRSPYTAATYCSTGSDTRDVIIDGRIILRDGQPQTLDPEKTIQEAEKASQDLLGE